MLRITTGLKTCVTDAREKIMNEERPEAVIEKCLKKCDLLTAVAENDCSALKRFISTYASRNPRAFLCENDSNIQTIALYCLGDI